MSQENVEIVRRGYEAWNEGGSAVGRRSSGHEDVEYHDLPSLPDVARGRGRRGAVGCRSDAIRSKVVGRPRSRAPSM